MNEVFHTKNKVRLMLFLQGYMINDLIHQEIVFLWVKERVLVTQLIFWA